MHLVLLAALAFASPSESPGDASPMDETASPSGLPGTVGRPLRLRVTKTALLGPDGAVQREWEKVERALLDLQAALYGEGRRASRNVGLEPGQPLRVRVDSTMRVRLEVLESERGWRDLRLQFEDQNGEPIDTIERATVQTSGQDETDLKLASSSEVIIENLEYAPGSAVRLYIGDGDVVVIWLEELSDPEP